MKRLQLHERFSFLQDPKILGLLALFLLVVIGIPATLYLNQKPTETRQNASFTGDSYDSCGFTSVSPGETPTACMSASYVPGMGSHSSGVTVHLLKHGVTIRIDWMSVSYWCPTRSSYQGSSCLSNPHVQQSSCTLTDQTPTCSIPATGQSPAAPYNGLACGFYQDDFAFNYHAGSYGGQGCHYGSYNITQSNSPGGATYCNAGDCHLPTPTPPPANTPTPTIPVNTPTPTVPVNTPTPTLPINTPTPTSIPTDTPTPGLTVTPTDSPTPVDTDTPTPTDNPSATPTPTGNPTATPTPTNNPTATPTYPPGTPTPTKVYIAVNTPKPTLPATGPAGDAIVTIGLVGAAIAVLGGLFLFGL